MKVRLLAIPLLFLLAGCGAAAQQAAPTPTPKPAPPALEKPTYTVERGEVVDQMQITGRVSPIQQQDLSFTQNGFVKTLYITRTSEITAGQLLAELDLADLPNQLRQAQVDYDQALANKQRTAASNDLAVRKAQLDLEDARAKLAALQAPNTAEDMAMAQAAVDEANASLDAVRANVSAAKSEAELALKNASEKLTLVQNSYAEELRVWNDIKDDTNNSGWQAAHDRFLAADAELHEAEDAVTKAQVALDTARQNEAASVRQAEANVTTTKAKLAALRKGSKPSDIADARRQVERAGLALEAARQGGDPEADSRLAVAKLNVERLQTQIDAGRLYAPFDGKIAALDLRPGIEVKAYQPVVRVMQPRPLEVLVDSLSVRNDAKLGVGIPVSLIFTRYPSTTYKGTIEQLPSSATSSTSTVNADNGYHIRFDTPDVALEVGDLAQVTVTLARKENALWLPPQAVRSFEGRRFVVVREGDRQRRKDVRVGITSEDRVEIVNGLEAGEIVVGQ